MASTPKPDLPSSSDDAVLATASPTGWRRWLDGLGHRDPSPVAQASRIVVAGFIAAVVVLYAFAWLAYEVFDQQRQALDEATLGFLRSFASPQLTLVAELISLMGNEVVWILALLLLGLFIWQRRYGAAAMLVLVAGGVQILNDVLKTVFHRARPVPVLGVIPAQDYSFPSGHAMVSAAFYFYLAYLVWHLIGGRWRTVVVAGLVVLVLLIGLSRLYLEAHYLSDVIAGYLAGFLWTDAVILGGHTLSARSHRSPTARHERGSANVSVPRST